MTSEDIRIALRLKYSNHRQYAIAEEVGLTTGYSMRRIDMIVVDCFASNGFRIDGIEIKISTGDLKNELLHPDKHAVFFDALDYYTIACPKGVVDPVLDVIPKNWGILIIDEDGSNRYKRRPLALHDRDFSGKVSRGFMASLIRNIQSRQPSDLELQKKYDEGYEKGQSDIKRSWDYHRSQVEEKYDRLREYDDLRYRLGLWGNNYEETLNEFESFKKCNLTFLSKQLSTIAESLNDASKLIDDSLHISKSEVNSNE